MKIINPEYNGDRVIDERNQISWPSVMCEVLENGAWITPDKTFGKFVFKK